MRKILLTLSFVLVISTSVFANNGIVGKEIQGIFPIFVDGKKLENDVIVVDGVSYFPVREASNVFGYKVDFDAEKKEVLLNKIEDQVSEELQVAEDKGGEQVVSEMIAYESPLQIIPTRGTMDKISYVQVGGEIYLNVDSLEKYFSYDRENKQITFELPERDPVTFSFDARKEAPYEEGADIFTIGFLSYVKASSIGIKAEISGDVMYIE